MKSMAILLAVVSTAIVGAPVYERDVDVATKSLKLVPEQESSWIEVGEQSVVAWNECVQGAVHKKVDIFLMRDIYYESVRSGLSPSLTIALIDKFSSFNQYAESGAATGLMGVHKNWPRVTGQLEKSLYHPRINLRYGTAVLRHLLDKDGTVDGAVAIYAAENGIKSQKFVPNVMSTFTFLERRCEKELH